MWSANDDLNRNFTPSTNNADSREEVSAFIGKGVEFKGVITYKGRVRIDGRMEGEICTDGALVIGDDAVVSAKINAGMVESSGKVTGDIIATEKVSLHAPGVMHGSVKAPLLSIEEGVLFTGNLEMTKADHEATGSHKNTDVTPLRVSPVMKAANG